MSSTVRIIVLLLGLAALVKSAERVRVVRTEIAQLAPAARRSHAHDRLLGRVIDVGGLVGEDRQSTAGGSAGGTLLWILDLDNCVACLDEVMEWALLEGIQSYAPVLLVLGGPDENALVQLRALRRTVVRRVDRGEVARRLGPLLPSTKLLLDSMGMAVLVDSRSVGLGCALSFESQVRALLAARG